MQLEANTNPPHSSHLSFLHVSFLLIFFCSSPPQRLQRFTAINTWRTRFFQQRALYECVWSAARSFCSGMSYLQLAGLCEKRKGEATGGGRDVFESINQRHGCRHVLFDVKQTLWRVSPRLWKSTDVLMEEKHPLRGLQMMELHLSPNFFFVLSRSWACKPACWDFNKTE